MSSESTKKIIGVSLGVCIVCSILVSSAAVSLRSKQEENMRLDKLKNILDAASLYQKGVDIEGIFKEKIKPEIIELSTGETLPKDSYPDILHIEHFNDFDIKVLVRNPALIRTLPVKKDIAKIKRVPKFMDVYLVKEGDEIEKFIFPIYGKGLWATMYGFIALGKDLKTIQGFTFYQQGETPGLGGEVDNPRWKQQWKGKQAFDDKGNLKIEVLKKGKFDPTSQDAKYQIDGLSGSTLTTRAVDQLVKFWLGNDGYGPFIERLKKEG